MIKKIREFILGKGIGGESIRYLIVGGLTTLVNFSVFVLMHEVLGFDDFVSNMVSIPLSILFAYVANKLFVFNWRCATRTELFLEFVKFVGSRLLTMALEVGAVRLSVSVLHINATLGKAVSQVLVVILNYIISKLLVFRRSDNESGISDQ